MLAIPEVVSSCAKLFSAAAPPKGTPSKSNCVPEAPSSKPVSPPSSSADRSSFHAVSNCAIVLTWPNSYNRANFSKMFKLRTNARADALVSPAIPCGQVSALPLTTLGCSAPQHKPYPCTCTFISNAINLRRLSPTCRSAHVEIGSLLHSSTSHSLASPFLTPFLP